MKFHALSDKEHVKKFLKLSTDSKLINLEQDLEATTKENPQAMQYNARILPNLNDNFLYFDNLTIRLTVHL